MEQESPVIAILDKAEDEAVAAIKIKLAEIKSKKAEIADIRRAKLALLGGAPDGNQPAPPRPARSSHPIPVGDAIIRAVEAGQKTPVDIFNYLADELDVHTTLGSVRARLSPLKSEGKISHDGAGWTPVSPSPQIPNHGDLLGQRHDL